MGKRGPAKGTGGRPKKKLSDKLIEGNPGKRPIKVLRRFPDLDAEEMPEPDEFLNDEQKNGVTFKAYEIYKETWQWLHERGCAQFVQQKLIEKYALLTARMIQLERQISQYGFLAKNSQGMAIESPYIDIALKYMKQSNSVWDRIYAIVVANCSTDYSEKDSKEEIMESILSGKFRKDA